VSPSVEVASSPAPQLSSARCSARIQIIRACFRTRDGLLSSYNQTPMTHIRWFAFTLCVDYRQGMPCSNACRVRAFVTLTQRSAPAVHRRPPAVSEVARHNVAQLHWSHSWDIVVGEDWRVSISARSGAVEPVGYAELLEQVKVRVRTSRVQAARTVNTELVGLYWQIGRLILDRQENR